MSIIREPGKFEGEPTYAPMMWDASLDGGMETIYDGETPVSVYSVEPEDIEAYPDLAGVDVVVLWEDSQGFVHSRQMTTSELETFRRECETDSEQSEVD